MAINELRAIDDLRQGRRARQHPARRRWPRVSRRRRPARPWRNWKQHLGVRLLHRTTRNLALTEEGQRLLESTQPALQALQRALHTAREGKDEIAGPLRIVGPKSSFAPVVMPVVDEFCRLHRRFSPKSSSTTASATGSTTASMSVSGSGVGEEGVVARRLFPVQLFICAAPSYLERHGDATVAGRSGSAPLQRLPPSGTGQVTPWYVNVDGEIVNRHVVPALSHQRHRTGSSGRSGRSGDRPDL